MGISRVRPICRKASYYTQLGRVRRASRRRPSPLLSAPRPTVRRSPPGVLPRKSFQANDLDRPKAS